MELRVRRGLRLLVTCGTSVQCGFHVGNRLPWRIVQGVHPFGRSLCMADH